MTPFLQFRLWLRRGPSGERVGAGIAAVALVALAAWAAVPVDDDDESAANVSAGATQTTLTGGTDELGETEDGAESGPELVAGSADEPAGGQDGAGPDTDASTGAAPDQASGASGEQGAGDEGGAPAGGARSAGRCSDLTSSDQGVSTTEILVAVPLINLAGDVGNETFGIRPDLEAVTQAVAAGINRDGGVACRKMRVKTWRVNPLDRNEQRAKCLEIVAAEPFAVVDFAAYLDPVARSCFPEHRLPYSGSTSLTEEEAAGSHPYMFSVLASTDRQLRNWVFESAARGVFDTKKDFRKLGLLLNACNPKVNAELRQNLAKVGVGNDRQSVFTTSCATVVPPSEISQAIVKHRNQDDVSHVLLAVPIGNAQSYVNQAARLGWEPTYTASDFGTVTNHSPAANWNDSFDGTVAITSAKAGEHNSGIVHPTFARCQEWMKQADVPPPTEEADAALALCDTLRLFTAAASAAGPNPTRDRLLDDGLAKVGHFQTANWGDGIYDRPGKVTGGDFIRPIQWRLDCRCWKLLQKEFRPGH